MELFAQQVMNGLVLGSVYSLVALGVTLIYGTMEIPNFAHGHLYMLGAYVTFAAVTGLDLHYWIGMVLAVAETLNNVAILAAVPLATTRLAETGPAGAMIVLAAGLSVGLVLTLADLRWRRGASAG